MRVAYLVSDYDAPSHTFVRREVAALRTLGTEVFAYGIRSSSSAESEATNILDCSLFSLFSAVICTLFRNPIRFLMAWNLARQHRPPGLRALLWSQFHFVEAMMFARMLSKADVSHLHVHFANSGATVGMLASHYLDLPWSMTLHGISETDYPAGLMLADKISRAYFVACASYFMQAQAMRVVPFEHWHKFHIVRCGLDLKNLSQIQNTSRVDNMPKLVCVGRLSPEKGHIGLVNVIHSLRQKGIDCTLTLVGDGPLRSEIETRRSVLGLEDRVFLAGFLQEHDTLAAIGASDIVVLPSFMEGLPVVLMEALGLGKPVIASQVAGIPELVVNGESGMLVTPSDLSALQDGIAKLLQHPENWTEMGNKGRLRVAEDFDIQRIATKMKSLIISAREQ